MRKMPPMRRRKATEEPMAQNIRDITKVIEENPLYILAGGAAIGLVGALIVSSMGPDMPGIPGMSDVPFLPPSGLASLPINPYSWGREKQVFFRRVWDPGEVGQSARRMVPEIWPGVPYEAFLGFAANGTVRGGTTEDTARPPPYGANNSFHEIGIYGTEAGRTSASEVGSFPGIPVPVPLAPAPGMQSNSWRALANNPDVVRLLGHPASLSPNGWTPVPDQTAVGIVNIRKAADRVARGIGRAAPNDRNSLWSVAIGFGGWSAGTSGMANHIRRYEAEIAQYPDAQKWGAFLAAVARDRPSGYKHSNPAYSAMRTWQKLEAGRQLAINNGSGRQNWFATGLPNEEEVAQVLHRIYMSSGGHE